MKGFVGFLLALALIGAAVAGGVALERKHAEGKFLYPWESTSQKSSSSEKSSTRTKSYSSESDPESSSRRLSGAKLADGFVLAID